MAGRKDRGKRKVDRSKRTVRRMGRKLSKVVFPLWLVAAGISAYHGYTFGDWGPLFWCAFVAYIDFIFAL